MKLLLNIFHQETLNRRGAGHWKDLMAFEALLQELGVAYQNVPFSTHDFSSVLDRCVIEVTDVVLHYSFWPELLAAIRLAAPNVRVHVRTVNAEALQHWQRSEIRWSIGYENIRRIYGCIRLLLRDARCRQGAHTLLGISSWDDAHYWRLLPGGAKVLDVPYHSPWPRLRPGVVPSPWDERRNVVVCLAGGRDRLGRSQIDGFVDLAENLRGNWMLKDWTFELSRGVIPDDTFVIGCPHVVLIDSLADPWELLCSVKVLALLTPLGFGAKTTVFDALAAGCHVIVHPAVHRRLPVAARDNCLVFDPSNRVGLAELVDRLEDAPAPNTVNEQLASVALDSLKSCLAQG